MTLLKTFQEEQDKEFEKLWKFSFDNEKGTSPYHNVLNSIHSREEALLKRIGEGVEKMKKETTNRFISYGKNKDGSENKDVIFCLPTYKNEYNQALDDIKNILQ